KIADIVAVKDNKVWVIETKLAFGSKVIEQAYFWHPYADYISIAVPRNYKNGYNVVLNFFIEQKGIGYFTVTKGLDEEGTFVHQRYEPKIIENNQKTYILESLIEAQKLSVAGSSS